MSTQALTYETLVENFNKRANVNWMKDLAPLFTINDKFTESSIEKIFHSFVIINLRTLMDEFLVKMPADSIDALTIDGWARHVVINQQKVNDLCSKLAAYLRLNAETSIPTPMAIEYQKRENLPLNQAHVKKMKQSMSYMNKIHKNFETRFIDELNKADEAKEVFAAETNSMMDAFGDASIGKLDELKKMVLHYKSSQDRVWTHLNNIAGILREYNKQRSAWAGLLIGIEGYVSDKKRLQDKK